MPNNGIKERMSATDTHEPVNELLAFLSKYDDIRRSVVREFSAETQLKLRGMTMHQHTAVEKIMKLTRQNPQGITLREFAQVMQSSPSSASVMVDSLVNRGLLERSQNPNDRRTVCIRLSEKGSKTLKESQELVKRDLAQLVDKLSAEERSQLAGIMSKLSA